MRHLGLALCLATAAGGVVGGVGCTSFASVRSAEVRPGPALMVQASLASPPGDEAAWFWSYDCPQNCDRAIPSADAAFSYGRAHPGARPYSLALGVNGTYPYVEGYVQLTSSARRPFGAGVRLGLPVWSWSAHQLYGRLDVPLSGGTRLLWNPALFYHTGNSPSGTNPGSFVGLVQGVGLELGDGPVALTPSGALVLGRAQRRSDGLQFGPVTRAFGTAALSITFRRSEPPASR